MPRSFGGIFLLSMLIVVGLAVSTTAVTNMLVSPWLLQQHIHDAQLSAGLTAAGDANVMEHVDIAARVANGISLGISLLVGIAAAAGASLYLSRQLNAAMARIAGASREIAKGNYSMRVERTALGEDMSALIESFNAMTARLEETEAHRRRLFSDLAHEIRTPVSILAAQMEALDDGVATLDDSRRVLHTQSGRLVTLSDDLSLLSRAEEGSLSYEMQPMDLAEAARDAVDSMAIPFSNRGVELALEPCEPVLLTADRQRILQVIGNLLNNALHATSATPQRGIVRVTVVRQGANASLSVTDNGKGLTEDQLSSIFERLYRVETARSRHDGGFGIGLAVSRQLVAAHHGTLRAASEGLGKGATFTMTLPIR
ncbi:MAG: ATP-binding protein [Bifidobacterium subtile]|jgi:signal transduction histidine kinase|nr:ATP-binding protein [Bifidobacterium subtile]MCI1240848.1 ATP-binding protein [Bifidobacterium subtile]